MHSKKQYLIMLLAIFLILYILPLGARDLFAPDETRYAEIPREMIATGDWVAPHLNGVRYFEKPVLGYWVHACSIALFGRNSFAVRLPSAMAAGLSALLIFLLMSHACHIADGDESRRAAIAALVFLTCFEVFGVGTFAVLDNLFSLFLTATIAAFYFASEARPGAAREKGFLLLAGASCGLAFLTKGFLAFAVPVLVMVPYLIWQRRYRDLWRMGCLPLLAAILVSLPWGILIHLREPDFWRYFFWNEHIRRFMASNAQHKESFWFYFLAAPGMFLPWAFVTPAAVAGMRERIGDRSPQGSLFRLSLCWFVLPFLFFSASKGKLLTYILPCFPPFAILLSASLSYLPDKGKSKAFQWGIAGAGVFFGIILLALIYIQLFGYKGFHPYSQPWKSLMAVNGLIFFILFCFWAFRCRTGRNKMLLLALAPMLLFFTIPFIMPDKTIQVKAPGPLLERHKQDIGPETVIISDEDTVRAVCWYLQRNDVYLLGDTGELDYGLKYDDETIRALDGESAALLINQNRGKAVLVARVKNIHRWRGILPAPVFQDDNGPGGYVLWRF